MRYSYLIFKSTVVPLQPGASLLATQYEKPLYRYIINKKKTRTIRMQCLIPNSNNKSMHPLKPKRLSLFFSAVIPQLNETPAGCIE